MPKTFTMRDPETVIAEQKARAARNQAAYKARKEEQAKQNAEAVRVLFIIIKKLVASPHADISTADADYLNELEARLKQ